MECNLLAFVGLHLVLVYYPKERKYYPKEDFTTQKDGDFTTQKENSTTQKSDFTTQKELTTTQKAVLDYFMNHPKGNRVDAALAIGGITEDGVKFIIGQLQQQVLKREGGRKNGTWVVTI